MRTSHCSSYQTLLVLVLFSVALPMVLGCVRHDAARAAAGEEASQAAHAAALTSPDTHMYFSPKVDLHELRFVFHNKGRLFVELSQPHAMLLDAFMLSNPSFPLMEQDFMTDDFPSEYQKFVFQNIPESRGEKYVVFYWRSFRCEMRTLSGIALYPTGDGGFRGFLGVLDGQPPDEKCTGDDLEVGLAFRSSTKARARPMQGETISEARKATISKFITHKLAGGDPWFSEWVDVSIQPPKFLEWIQIFTEYPATKAVLALVEVKPPVEKRPGGESMTYLFCVLEGEKEDEVAIIQGGELLFEDKGGQTDISPWESELFILPDMDGNGANELLVVSTESWLFAIVHEYDWDNETYGYFLREVRRIYFGP